METETELETIVLFITAFAGVVVLLFTTVHYFDLFW